MSQQGPPLARRWLEVQGSVFKEKEDSKMIPARRSAILALGVMMTLGGCQQPEIIRAQSGPRYELKHTTKTLELCFPNHRLQPDDEADLQSAIAPPGGPGKVSTHVTIPSRGSSPGKHRLKQIVRIVLRAGIKEKQIHRSDALPPAMGKCISILVDTYRAIPPVCPNWKTAYGTSYYDIQPMSDLGCSTASNLILMIDDPILLFKGEKALPRDGAREALAIAEHRLGKDKGKWLKSESGSSSSGSSGSSGTPSVAGQS
jgi:pilus biogenesis lipoprotein CpaD